MCKGDFIPITIKIQPFNYDVTIFTTKKEFAKYFKLKGLDTAILDGVIGYCCNIEDETNSELSLLLPSKYNEGITIHESVHLSWFVLEIAQVPLNSDTQEIQAYLVEYIVKQIKENVYTPSKPRLPKK